MPSTNKTANFNLPQFVSTDKPDMQDFNEAFANISNGVMPSTTKIKMDKILTSPVTFAALNTEYNGALGFPAGMTIDSYAYFIVKIGTAVAAENTDVIIDTDTKKSAWLDYVTTGYHASGYTVIGTTEIAVSCKECTGWTLSQLSLSQVYGVRLG